ncbi:MAG: UDP-2,3-diacylglucosamine diphosphatase [Verrucomicrobia bacterium]|nr:UDP-2,3-diacylglucosamine diphosphatase [Verrucomicrobiota bacterium]
MAHWRTGWISDFHLGMKGSKAGVLLDFLRENDFDRLYLVGDIIDVLALRRGIFWPQEHNDVIQKLLRKGRKGTELIYIPGNHDGFVTGYLGTYGSVTLQKHAIHTTANGRRILVFHGHELDALVQNLGWLGHAGDFGYTVLLRSNGIVNLGRRLLGLEPWSLSAYVKGRVRNVATFISNFEEAVVRYAQDYKVDGVICGHLHTATVRRIGATEYYNTGDWIESCTALVEDCDGTIKLIRQAAETRPREHAADLDRESVGT